jgi:hypothetical protein
VTPGRSQHRPGSPIPRRREDGREVTPSKPEPAPQATVRKPDRVVEVPPPPKVKRELPKPQRLSNEWDRPDAENPLSQTAADRLSQRERVRNPKRGWQKLDERAGVTPSDGPGAQPKTRGGRLPKAPDAPETFDAERKRSQGPRLVPREDEPGELRVVRPGEVRREPLVDPKAAKAKQEARELARIEGGKRKLSAKRADKDQARGDSRKETEEIRARNLEAQSRLEQREAVAVAEERIRQQIRAKGANRRPPAFDKVAVGDPATNPKAFEHQVQVVGKDGKRKYVNRPASDLEPVTARVELVDNSGRHIVLTRHGEEQSPIAREKWLVHGIELLPQLVDGDDAGSYASEAQDENPRAVYRSFGEGNKLSTGANRPRLIITREITKPVQFFDSELVARAAAATSAKRAADAARAERKARNRREAGLDGVASGRREGRSGRGPKAGKEPWDPIDPLGVLDSGDDGTAELKKPRKPTELTAGTATTAGPAEPKKPRKSAAGKATTAKPRKPRKPRDAFGMVIPEE